MLLHFTIILVLVKNTWAVCRPFIRLEDNLDETKNLGFCPDVLGWGSTIRLDQALQVSRYRTVENVMRNSHNNLTIY